MSENSAEVKFGGDASGAITAAQQAAIALKGKVNALLAELIRAHVWIWHCGGSEDYGFPGPSRTRPAPGAVRSNTKGPFGPSENSPNSIWRWKDER